MNLGGVSNQPYCSNFVTTNRAESKLCLIKVTWSYNGDVISSPQIIHNLIGSLCYHIVQLW